MRSAFILLLTLGACSDPGPRDAPRRVEPESLVPKPPPGVRVLVHGQPNRPDVASLISTEWCGQLSTGEAMSTRLGVPGLEVGTKADDSGLACTWSVPCPAAGAEKPAPAGSEPSARGDDPAEPECYPRLALQLTVDCKPELHVKKKSTEWIDMHLGMGGKKIEIADGASYLFIPDRVARLEVADNGCTLSYYSSAQVVSMEAEPLEKGLLEFAHAVSDGFPPVDSSSP
jgi:hypothetical protein